MIRVLHVEPAAYGPDARRILDEVALVDYVECADHDALVAVLAGAPYEALFTRLGLAIDARTLEAAPALRYVVTPTTGLDHIDLAETARRGVRVISLRGEVAFLETIRSTAEHTFALLLALVRRIPVVHAEVLAGSWTRGEPGRLGELADLTLAIAGCGRLGRMVAGYGLAFGMSVLVHDHDPAQLARAPAGVETVELDALLGRAHVLSLHLPLADDTHGWLDDGRLTELKRGAVLINTARGELVDEQALLVALGSGQLAGAALDVLAGDSRWEGVVPAGHPLVAYARVHENLILTPHVAGYGRSSLDRARRFVATRFAEIASAGAPS